MQEVQTPSTGKRTSDKDVNLTNAGRDVWLVKVPKYVADRWESSPPLSNVGQIKIVRQPGVGKPTVTLNLDDQIVKERESDNSKNSNFHVWSTTLQEIPRDHKFMMRGIAAQHLAVLSQITSSGGGSDDVDEAAEGGQSCSSKLAVEGKVSQRADCAPIQNQLYLNLKREALLKPTETARKIQRLNKLVKSYKPVSNQANNVAYERKMKGEGKKYRSERETVMESLFALFEKHQYYNIKDLVRETRQPVTYLKTILSDVCHYNVKNPHRNMWELKPEYRHYKKAEGEEEKAAGDDDSSDDQ